jgi:3-hydroxyacyl-[acyl-carrier-protein] dehydratase
VRFHLIDRIDAWESARWVRARKLTSRAEEYWRRDGEDWVMPRPLVLEVFCQAGVWLVVLTTDGKRRPALLSVGSAEFQDDAHPGDLLEIDGRVEAMDEETAVLSGTVSAGGRLLLEARDVMCVLMDADQLDSPEETARMQRLIAPASG